MRQFLAIAAILLLCQTAIRAQEEEKSLNSVNTVADITAANIQSAVRSVGNLINKTPQQTPAQATTVAPPTTVIPATTRTTATTALPATTPSSYLNPIVSFSQAQRNQPYVEQAGSTALFPSNININALGINNRNFLVGPGTSRYLVIGDWGRIGSLANLDLPECSFAGYGGNNDIQGGLQQQQSALLADQVCGLLGGCQGILGTGDNFYQCGVYPNDSTQRFKTDWQNVYQTTFTPNLQNLTWYNVFGNHDIVINGSVEAQIAYSQVNPKWQMRTNGTAGNNYYFLDLPTVAGGPRIRAFFLDTNPFVAQYNTPTQKYNKTYYQQKTNARYVDDQLAWLEVNLASSTADHNLVLSHYPLFGSGTQYGADTSGSIPAYPGNFNGWQKLLQIIYRNRVTSYLNGHDHLNTAGNPAQAGAPIAWNNHTTFLTTGAGGWGEPADSCGTKGALYTNGGNGGFIMVSANATTFQSDFFSIGSLYSQCTITAFSDKARAPLVSDNCKLGIPNACCNALPPNACY